MIATDVAYTPDERTFTNRLVKMLKVYLCQ